MTTMQTDARVTRPARRPRARRRSPETLVFAAAMAVAIVHAVDDAIVHREPGVGVAQHLLAALLAVGLGLGAIAAFPRLRPGLRAAAAFVLGSLAAVNGAVHVLHVAGPGFGASDVTGVVAAAAGVVLVGLAAAIPWRHRSEGAGGRRRRWARRTAAAPLGLVTVAAVAAMGVAIYETHEFPASIGAPPSRDYREVAFDAADGVHLAGWYRPTRNGATVLVLHGGGGDRTGALAHARLLVRHGYGVLLYDARGRGESDGVQNSWGWGWPKDVAGALAFLHTRPEVDPARIGALGLSTGADVLVQVAGERSDLEAVVADGTAASSFEDAHRVSGWSPMTPFTALYFATVGVTSGTRPGPALDDSIRRITSPLLLISAGLPEKPFADHYARVAGDGPVEHWHLPSASHTAGIREAAPEYERRVIAFLDRALRAR
jgi:dienelactone hydrolase